jgi:hypothetical protein
MRIDIHTNVQPIVAGDDISISIHLETWEAVSTLGYGVALAMPVQRTLASFVPIFRGFDYGWTADVVGQQVVFQVTLYPAVHSDFSNPVTVTPAVPVLTAPADDELLHAGSPYTFRWTQVPPAPTNYRLRFSTDGAQTFPELGADFSGNADHVTRTIPGAPTDHGLVRLEGLWPGFDPLFDPPIGVRTTSEVVLHVFTPATWHIGEEGSLSWDAVGNVDHFKVDFSRDGGHTWTTLAANVAGSERHLTVPIEPPASTSCRVRVTAFGGGHSTSATSGNFRVAGVPPHHGGRGPRD